MRCELLSSKLGSMRPCEESACDSGVSAKEKGEGTLFDSLQKQSAEACSLTSRISHAAEPTGLSESSSWSRRGQQPLAEKLFSTYAVVKDRVCRNLRCSSYKPPTPASCGTRLTGNEKI